jgi:hypothetical protein
MSVQKGLQRHKEVIMDSGNIISIIRSIQEIRQLELAAQTLTPPQFLIIVDAISQKVLPESKLLPLLVGLPTETFIQILTIASAPELDLLKLESVTEPIQHHLTTFSNKAEKASEQIAEDLIRIGKWIQQIDMDLISKKELGDLRDQLSYSKGYFQELLAVIDKALAVTWNTNRLDLIEKFTSLKEHSLITLYDFIGSPRDGEEPATGMYDQLGKRFAMVFNDSDLLKDSDPATEALAMFSIWYLKDYWRVGLLPSVKTEEDLEPIETDDIAKRDHRQKLFSQVQENLNRLGIGTVGDLKKAEIFSQKLLKEYLSTHRNQF